MYQLVLDQSPGIEAYQPAIRRIREVLTDALLYQIIGELPADMDPARKDRIARTLAWRRDRLPEAMETFLASRADRLSSKRFRDRILSGNMAVSSAAFHFIVTYLLGGHEPTSMEAPTMRLQEARRALTSRGISREDARVRVDRLMIRTTHALGQVQVEAYGAPDPRLPGPPAPVPSPPPGAAVEAPRSPPQQAILAGDPLFHGGEGGPGARYYARFQQLNHRYLELDLRLVSLIRSGDTQASAGDRARTSFPLEAALAQEQGLVPAECSLGPCD